MTYWPEPRPNLQNGLFVSSDLARVEKGSVHLRGRQSDQINVAGRKVSPETIERALALHPGVRACLVFGAPSRTSDRAEMIVACIVPEQETNVESLRQHLLGKFRRGKSRAIGGSSPAWKPISAASCRGANGARGVLAR